MISTLAVRLALGLFFGCVISAAVFAQDQQAPFTTDELLRRLKLVAGQRYEQGDLAGEIVQRRMAFALGVNITARYIGLVQL
jgi:hypothetical protein